MLNSGTYFAERYEIIETIGTGGMSDVYKAKDHMLGRDVAIKVLKPEFAGDVVFVSKFRQEAQSAAGLEHPNIVNIYDVGSQNGLYYIVMEYVQGVTLKTYIAKKGRLNYKEVISIAIQVGRGIEAAHSNNIIHRDIKPQNIMISKEGKVKVMDFGIARAATSHTINTQAMGSVHYASPEQARNGYVGFQSDIYSLGIVMYEMVTGRLPFDGDSTVAVAIQHLQSEITPPSVYVEDLPISVEKIILKCTMKSPERRYATMADLMTDLKKAYVDPTVDFVVIPEVDGRTRVVTDDQLKQILDGAEGGESEEDSYGSDNEELFSRPRRRADQDTEELTPRTRRTSEHKAEHSSSAKKRKSSSSRPEERNAHSSRKNSARSGSRRGREEEDDIEEAGSFDRVITVIGVIAAVAIVVIFVYLLGSLFGIFSVPSKSVSSDTSTGQTTEASSGTTAASTVTVPDLVGNTRSESISELENLGLSYEITEVDSDRYDAGIVIAQTVEAGTSVSAGTKVGLTVSAGSGSVEIPSVVGLDEKTAVNNLTEAGFTVQKNYEYSTDVAELTVMSQTPDGNSAGEEGDTVTITISQGIPTVQVPNMLGMTQAQAEEALSASYLVASIKSEYNDAAYGQVINQSIVAGKSVDAGTVVTITVSLGPNPLAGYTQAADTNVTMQQ